MTRQKSLNTLLDELPALLDRTVDSFGTEVWVFFYKGREVKFYNDEGSHMNLKQAIQYVLNNHKE